MQPFKCPLTDQSVSLDQVDGRLAYYYDTKKTGKVSFTNVALGEAENLSAGDKALLAGICRNRAIKEEQPLEISTAFIKNLHAQSIPFGFEERCLHLLQYMYDNGGKEYKEFQFDSWEDCPIAYSTQDEFERIIRCLEGEGSIKINSQPVKDRILYSKVLLTKGGIAEVEKGLPKMPLISLVDQEIKSGDPEVDATINHARKLFFDQPTSMDAKRSACESLSYVLEPLRNDCKKIFSGDTETFFNIVNSFDVRHNKNCTAELQHEEQLEWIYYSLLNTINTYVKMKRKLS